jgi:hypothetical protein
MPRNSMRKCREEGAAGEEMFGRDSVLPSDGRNGEQFMKKNPFSPINRGCGFAVSSF